MCLGKSYNYYLYYHIMLVIQTQSIQKVTLVTGNLVEGQMAAMPGFLR
jgi:hypothetical protein